MNARFRVALPAALVTGVASAVLSLFVAAGTGLGSAAAQGPVLTGDHRFSHSARPTCTTSDWECHSPTAYPSRSKYPSHSASPTPSESEVTVSPSPSESEVTESPSPSESETAVSPSATSEQPSTSPSALPTTGTPTGAFLLGGLLLLLVGGGLIGGARLLRRS